MYVVFRYMSTSVLEVRFPLNSEILRRLAFCNTLAIRNFQWDPRALLLKLTN